MGQKPHHIQLTLPHAPEAVFAAWTDPAALTRWLAEFAEVDLENGVFRLWGRYTPGEDSQPGGADIALRWKKNRLLTFSWLMNGEPSTVTVRLLEEVGGTRLILTHTGIPKGFPFWLEDIWFLCLENLRRYLDGKQAAFVDLPAVSTGNFGHTVDVDAPLEAVFDALITPAQLNRWIAPDAKVDPREGGEYSYGWPEGGPSKILELVPNEKLAHNWQAWGGFPETVVTWTLEGSGGKTRLTMVTSGFGPDDDSGGEHVGWLNFMNWVRSIAEYGAGWQPPISKLPEEMKGYYSAAIAAGQAALIE